MKKDQIFYFKVVCKCGHVGRNHYVPIQFAIKAPSRKMAAQIARNLPRVKHQHKDAILDVIKITYEQYYELKKINEHDPYLQCHSKHEQKNSCDLTDRLVSEKKNINRKIEKKTRKERITYKIKKNKLMINYAWENEYDYLY